MPGEYLFAPRGVHPHRRAPKRAHTCRVRLPILIRDLPVSTLLLRWLCSALQVASRPPSLLELTSADMMPVSLHRTSLVMHACWRHMMLR